MAMDRVHMSYRQAIARVKQAVATKDFPSAIRILNEPRGLDGRGAGADGHATMVPGTQEIDRPMSGSEQRGSLAEIACPLFLQWERPRLPYKLALPGMTRIFPIGLCP